MTVAPGDVRLLVLDVDGVLTDGTLHYGPDGEATKSFYVRDGLGIKRLLNAGIEVAVVTGRGNAAVATRMAELGVDRVITGCDDKWPAVAALLDELSIPAAQVACVGDDVTDLPVMQRVGLAIAVADAHPDVRAAAHWRTTARGGRGAVREIADRLCAAREPLRFRVAIPTRYAAKRLPGKPLRLLAGNPLIAHVWDRAIESGAHDVVVATDDDRIREVVEGFGGRVAMTSADCASGTDRIAELARRERWADDDIVINLQGDEPLMPGALLRRVAEALRDHPRAGITTLATPIRAPDDVFDPNVVKVVIDEAGYAAYFSRAPVPWVRERFADRSSQPALPDDVPFFRHLGLYAYRALALRTLAKVPPSPLERAESLEQLRAIAHGIPIHVTVVDEAPGHGVDTEVDLARVERELAHRP